MSRLDDELRNALRREDPGEDFTKRVLERAAALPPKRSWRERLLAVFGPAGNRWAAGALAASLLIGVGGIEYRRQQRMRAEGEAAKAQLMVAMRIAGSKLRLAREKVMQVGEE
jgi:hypothetical protein